MNALRRLTAESFGEEWISRKFEEANTTKVKENAWDLALFMFYAPLGCATNMMVFVCVAFNLLLQLSFTYLVSRFIASSNEDLHSLARAFHVWGNGVDVSVRTAVCESSFEIGSDYKQISTYMTFDEYSGYGGIWSPGLMLCLTVCSTWSLSVLKVVGEVVDQVKAVWHITSRESDIMEIAVVDTGFTLERIPLLRCLFFIFLSTVQLLIACTLLVAGLQWLGTTTDIVELLLNGVALAYIMDIDELTYKVLVPTKLDTLIRRLEPISVGWSLKVPARSVVLSMPLFFIIVLTLEIVLKPNADAVFVVQDTLCP